MYSLPTPCRRSSGVEQRFRNLTLCSRRRSLHWTECGHHRPPCRISAADVARIAIRKKSRWRLWVTVTGLIHTQPARPTIMVSTFTLRMAPGLRPNMLSLRMTVSASLPGVIHPFGKRRANGVGFPRLWKHDLFLRNLPVGILAIKRGPGNCSATSQQAVWVGEPTTGPMRCYQTRNSPLLRGPRIRLCCRMVSGKIRARFTA